MKRVIVHAPAKINLALEIVRRRPDGYHDLRTVMHTLALADRLTLSSRPSGVVLTCKTPGVPTDEKNLAVRAALALQQAYAVTQGVHIHLTKKIPVAAGMGGGSSDAAATLRGLVRLWGLPWEAQRLTSLAASLGSDVPFLLKGGCALGTGRGDRIFPWPVLAGIPVVVVNPGFAVSTAEVYKRLKLPLTREKNYINLMRPAVFEKNPQKIGKYLFNHLETVTLSTHPQVRRIKLQLLKQGASAVLMSGSGPTVFGLVDQVTLGRKIVKALTPQYPFVCLTQTADLIRSLEV
jgi:4-diphosphocytidyl-2-C-methyl-D-erythritol kinase